MGEPQRATILKCYMCSAHGKTLKNNPKQDLDCFPTHQDPADQTFCVGRIFILICFERIFEFQISKFPNSQIPGFPDSRFRDLRIPDAGGAGRILGFQPEPPPNAPRDQIGSKEPGALAMTSLEGVPRK